MKTIQTTIYECEFCKKYYKRKYACIRHELLCFNNPNNNRACFTCGNLRKKDVELETHFSTDKVTGIFYCTKLEEFLFTPQNEIKKNELEFSIAMKKECEFWREQNFDDYVEQNK